MAYMSQERKRELAPKIKQICKKYGVKATLGVRNYSTLTLTLKSGKIDFLAQCPGNLSYYEVNPYWIERDWTGKARDFLVEVSAAMNVGNHDNSDIMTDYFDVGWYIDICIGKWNKAYTVVK